MIELIIASIALVIAAAALIRSYIPPQQRQVADLTAAVADLQYSVETFGNRLTGWKRGDGMEQAREKLKTRRAASDKVLEEAAAVLEAVKGAPPLPQQQQALPLTKEALRREFNIVR